MEIALEFCRHDVDAFLDEIDHDAFEEWEAYFILRPPGWRALNMATARLSYVMAQTHSSKTVFESNFELKPAGNLFSAAVQAARAQAHAIRSGIRERLTNGRES